MGIPRITLGAIAVLVLAGCSTMRVRSDFSERASFTELKTYKWIQRETDQTRREAVTGPLVDRHVHRAVDAELARKGFERVESGKPDFLITYRIITRERIGSSDTSASGSYAVAGAYGNSRRVARRGIGYRHGRGAYHGRGYHRGHRGHYGYGLYGSRHYRHGRRGYLGFAHYGGHYGYGYGYGYGYPYGGYVDEYLEGTLVLAIIDPVANEIIWRGWASDAMDSDPSPNRVRKYVNEAVTEILARFPPTA